MCFSAVFSLCLEAGDSPIFICFSFFLSITGAQQSNSIVHSVLQLFLKAVEIKARPQVAKACRQCPKWKCCSACKLGERKSAVFRQSVIALGVARGVWY